MEAAEEEGFPPRWKRGKPARVHSSSLSASVDVGATLGRDPRG